MYVREIGIRKLDTIKDLWIKLEKADDMTIFQSYSWNRYLVKEYKSQLIRRTYRHIKYICVFEETEIIMIAPLRIKTKPNGNRVIKEIELLGEDSFSDYCNFIYKQPSKIIFDLIFEYLNNKYKDYRIIMRDVMAGSSFGGYLQKNNKNFFVSNKTVWIKLDYENSEEYFKGLSKHVRQNYRTACNRLNKDGMRLTWKIVDGNIEKKTIREMIDVNYKRSIEKNKSERGLMYCANEWISKYRNNFIKRLVNNRENVWGLVTYINDDMAGFLLGMADEHRIYVMMNKVNVKYEFYSPVIVSTIQCIEFLISNESYVAMDFGRGTEKYKYDLGGNETLLVGIQDKIINCGGE